MIHWFFTHEVTIYLWMVWIIYVLAFFVASRIDKFIQRQKFQIQTKYYLRSLKIRFPDSEDITLIAVETSDEAAMDKIKEQLRDEHRKRVQRRA